MQCNVGNVDKTIRIVLGVALIIVGVMMKSWIIGIIGLIPLGTGLAGFCPLYTLIGLNTGCKPKGE